MAAKWRQTQRAGVASVDPIWTALREEAEEVARNEPALGGFVYATILNQPRLEDAVCHRLAQRLNHSDVDAGLITQTFGQVLADHPSLPVCLHVEYLKLKPVPFSERAATVEAFHNDARVLRNWLGMVG